jgi:tetratricopeptide (TPR) repeat protein
VQDAPRSANAHDYLGRVYAQSGRDDDALAQFAVAARLLEAHPAWPERLDVLYQTATIHDRRADFATSERLYLEIVGHDPRYFPAWINLGALRNRAGRHVQALEAADHAIAVRPDVPNAYVVRGAALRGLGRHAEALGAFEAALARAPGAIEALFGIGASAIELGDFAKATRAFERVVAGAPSPDAYRGLVMSLRATGQAEEARRVAEQARMRYPDEPAFHSGAPRVPG